MSDENTMNKTIDTTATVPPAPNGHRSPNGAANGEPREADTATEGATKDTAPSSSSSKKKKKGHRHNQKPPESIAVATTDQPAPTEPTEPAEPQPSEVSAAAPIEDPPAAPTEVPVESLRIRMKIWTDPTTAKRYLMPSALMRDVVNGQPVSDVMYAYALRDDSTKVVTLTAAEWNALPFFYFQEDGAAPRAATRPLDDLPVSYAKTP